MRLALALGGWWLVCGLAAEGGASTRTSTSAHASRVEEPAGSENQIAERDAERALRNKDARAPERRLPALSIPSVRGRARGPAPGRRRRV